MVAAALDDVRDASGVDSDGGGSVSSSEGSVEFRPIVQSAATGASIGAAFDSSPFAAEALRQARQASAVKVQAAWRGHVGRRSALRLFELRMWEEDLALERTCITAMVYAVALLLLAASTFICLVFGVLFTPEQARVWLLTSLASFALDLLVQKPVVIFVNAVALTVWGACTGRTASWTNVSPNFVGTSGAWIGVI
ncbi:hypothetical protein FNF28_07804 [Cafeteria roenbergensis]|uniref:Uncharacterized protein n=1 Tax=Cafeteria roenbergensis TaxID=33653 RepID=A0A5A8BYG7_CAFRO|nr:hypothetical protein FNF28_07804 [Cafeteria roenbergensis]